MRRVQFQALIAIVLQLSSSYMQDQFYFNFLTLQNSDLEELEELSFHILLGVVIKIHE